MKYFRTWKEADATRELVTKDEARKSIEGSYKGETVEDILNTPNIYPCLFAIIEIEND